MERDYKKEYEDEKKRNKHYVVKVPIWKAQILDTKLNKEGKYYSDIATQAIDNYLKKK